MKQLGQIAVVAASSGLLAACYEPPVVPAAPARSFMTAMPYYQGERYNDELRLKFVTCVNELTPCDNQDLSRTNRDGQLNLRWRICNMGENDSPKIPRGDSCVNILENTGQATARAEMSLTADEYQQILNRGADICSHQVWDRSERICELTIQMFSQLDGNSARADIIATEGCVRQRVEKACWGMSESAKQALNDTAAQTGSPKNWDWRWNAAKDSRDRRVREERERAIAAREERAREREEERAEQRERESQWQEMQRGQPSTADIIVSSLQQYQGAMNAATHPRSTYQPPPTASRSQSSSSTSRAQASTDDEAVKQACIEKSRAHYRCARTCAPADNYEDQCAASCHDDTRGSCWQNCVNRVVEKMNACTHACPATCGSSAGAAR